MPSHPKLTELLSHIKSGSYAMPTSTVLHRRYLQVCGFGLNSCLLASFFNPCGPSPQGHGCIFIHKAMNYFRNQYQSMMSILKRRELRAALVLTLVYSLVSNATALDFTGIFNSAAKVAQTVVPTQSQAAEPGAAGKVEVGFSPEGSALALVLKTINSSTKTLDVMAYSFTSADVTRALINARRRGVQLRVVVDEKQNLSSQGSKYAVSALSSLVTAGAEVRINGNYAIFHDKVIISDGAHVQTGSYNYSKAAANSNSENVVVMWGSPALATQYSAHFKSRWSNAKPFTGRP